MPHSNDTLALPTRKRAAEFRIELKVLTTVAIFIILLEIVSRMIAPYLDSAAVHIHDFPRIVKELKEKSNDVPKVLFYGNSLMMHGLDHGEIIKKFDNKKLLHTAKVTPVGTNIVDWTYLYQQYFESKETHPDLLIVGFVKHHIADSEPVRERRLARHFVGTKDLPQLWREDLNEDFHRSVQSSLSHFSSLMGDQPEHQLGILHTIIPSYQPGLNLNNDLVRAEQAQSRAEKPLTVVRLKRFITLAKRHNVEVWFVPMPQPDYYNIPQLSIDTIKASGMHWLDARQIKGMTPEDFSDGYHLGKTGNVKFTTWMSEKLSNYLSESKN